MPGTAITSRTRFFRRAIARPRGAPIREAEKYPASGVAGRQASRRESSGDAAVCGVHEVAIAPGVRADTWASNTIRSSPIRRSRCRFIRTSARIRARLRAARCFSFPSSVTAGSLERPAVAAWPISIACRPISIRAVRWTRWSTISSRRSRCCSAAAPSEAFDLTREPDEVRRALWKAPVVPAGAGRPAAGRSRRGVCDARS